MICLVSEPEKKETVETKEEKKPETKSQVETESEIKLENVSPKVEHDEPQLATSSTNNSGLKAAVGILATVVIVAGLAFGGKMLMAKYKIQPKWVSGASIRGN